MDLGRDIDIWIRVEERLDPYTSVMSHHAFWLFCFYSVLHWAIRYTLDSSSLESVSLATVEEGETELEKDFPGV